MLKKIIKKLKSKKTKKVVFILLIAIMALIIINAIISSVDFLSSKTVFTGLLGGGLIVLWGLYFLFKHIKSKLGNLTKEGAILWMKSFSEVAKFLNVLTSLIGYPAFELARVNNKLSEEAIKLLSTVLKDLSTIAKQIAWFGTAMLVALAIGVFFPATPISVILLVILIVISFTVMGLVDPIVKPLGDKPLRRIIRPISLVLPLFGSIFIFSAHGPEIAEKWANIFFGYLVVLMVLSFKSYHGMYTSDAARYWLWSTVIFLLITLGLTKISFWDSEYFQLINNKTETITEFVKKDNAESKLNLVIITDTIHTFKIVGGKMTPLITIPIETNSNDRFLLYPGETVSKLNTPIVYDGAEGFTPVRVKNKYGLYTDDPIYVPTKFIGKYNTYTPVNDKNEKNLKVTEQIQDTLRYNFPDGTLFKIVTKSGKPFLQANGKEWDLRQSGQMFQKVYSQDIVRGTVDGEEFSVIVQ